MFESYGRRREREVRGVMEKVNSELITLDTNFLGRLGEAKKEAFKAKETPFHKKSRLERLRIEGKADEEEGAEGASDGEEDGDGDEAGMNSKEREEKKNKMRGKNKSTKRYLRKKRKNVIDPAMVSWLCTTLESTFLSLRMCGKLTCFYLSFILDTDRHQGETG